MSRACEQGDLTQARPSPTKSALDDVETRKTRQKTPRSQEGDTEATLSPGALGHFLDHRSTRTSTAQELAVSVVFARGACQKGFFQTIDEKSRPILSVDGWAISRRSLDSSNVHHQRRLLGDARWALSLVVPCSSVWQEHLVGHPIYVPRGARKRMLALAELVRLQMKAETRGVTTAMEVRRTV